MHASRGLLAAECLAAASLVAAAAWQKLSGGIQLELLLLGALLLPAHARRLLAWRGLATPPAPWLLLLELAAVGALRSQHVPPLALGLGLLAGLLPAVGGGGDAPAARGLRPLMLAGLLLGAGALGWALAQERPLALLRALLLLPLLAEALLPGGERDGGAELRRGACGLGVGALTLVREPAPDLELLSSLAALLAGGVGLRLRGVPPPERRRTARRTLLRLSIPLLVPGLLLAGGELVFRLVDDDYGRRLAPRSGEPPALHVPGAEYLHRGAPLQPQLEPVNAVRWNQGGWHDADHALERAPGVVRVLVLGDSYVEGVQVPRDALFHRVLERELAARGGAPVEAIAYGWSGWGQREELVALKEGRSGAGLVPQYPPGLAFDPDLVLVEFLAANDVRNNLPELEAAARREETAGTFARALYVTSLSRGLRFSAMLCDKTDQVLRRLRGQRDPLDAEVYREPALREPELWARAWGETATLVEQIAQTAAGRGLLVVGFSSPMEIAHAAGDPAAAMLDFGLPHRRMASICARLQLPYLPLPERFARLGPAERDALHGKGDQHWTVAGHRQAAQETARYLLEESDLWARARARASGR